MTTPTQMTFDWPTTVATGPDDFFISPANEMAFNLLMSPQNWPSHKLLLVGPQSAGKSHLFRIWKAQFGGTIQHINALKLDLSTQGPILIEDADMMHPDMQETLFHIYNHAHHNAIPLIISARSPAIRWRVTLPDLKSRMQSFTDIRISDPDDGLMSVLLLKHFKDRQLSAPPNLITYLTKRLERSFHAAFEAVDALDKMTLQEKKPLTLPIATRLFEEKTLRI